jgi:ribosome biogenesis GTPase A
MISFSYRMVEYVKSRLELVYCILSLRNNCGRLLDQYGAADLTRVFYGYKLVDCYRIGYRGEGKSSLLLSIIKINKSTDRRINE